MNVRKFIDYSAMFSALDMLMTADLPQMKLYFEIGRLVGERPEKGAAVAASEYLCNRYSDLSGFSPRNLRRMREFYRTYGGNPEALQEAMTIGWTQNVVILESNLTLQERVWYIHAVRKFGWSKLTLLKKIKLNSHTEAALDSQVRVCYTEEYHTRDQKSGLSPRPPQAVRTWHRLYWTKGPTNERAQLQSIQFADQDGQSQSMEYAPYLRRRLRRKAASIHDPPRCGNSRSVVHRYLLSRLVAFTEIWLLSLPISKLAVEFLLRMWYTKDRLLHKELVYGTLTNGLGYTAAVR